EKNVVIAIVLSVLVLLGFQFLNMKLLPPPPEMTAPVATESAPTTGPATSAEVAQALAQAPVQATTPAATPTVAVPEKEVTVETDLYRAVFSTTGATLKSFEIKRHVDEAGKPVNAAALVSAEGNRPLVVLSGGKPVVAAFQPDTQKLVLSTANPSASLSFSYVGPDGLAVTKKLTFYNDDYKIDLDLNLQGGSDYRLALGTGMGLTSRSPGGMMGVHEGPVTMVQGKREADETSKLLEARKSYTGGVAWTAIEDKYFMAALVPQSQISLLDVSAVGTGDAALPDLTVALTGSGAVTAKFLLYVGPKQYDRLAALKVGLEDIIDYGWFKLFAKPMFHFMQFLYGIFGNYGIAIIIMTIIIKVAFIPLTHKSTKSMKEMQRIQPELTKLKEKYKNDPTSMNREMMDLYKKHKVNPLGGCLPMVIQIPVFIALYNVLLVSIELRHAPFFWWIHDLSAPDALIHVMGFPVGPLPVLMGISMFVMQKMTPTTITDPMQQKIMLWMPVIFSVMFFTFPAGLVLYWLVNNSLQIVQQYVTNKYIK
ncbi:MAG: membrane protein insertase YidC, partial [Nitrospirota bacterium]|nr:membrane protein insertase YidC [Nitrospirota bacterium]